jgi:hypothetical protein
LADQPSARRLSCFCINNRKVMHRVPLPPS